jgi:opacity protein-like surface antigen
MKRDSLIVLTVIVAIMLMAIPAKAETGSSQESKWQFDFTPYIWLAGIDGDVRSGRFSTGGVEATFTDIFQDLNGAFLGTFEVRKGRWGILLDAVYLDISGTTETPDHTIGNVHTKLTQGMYSLAGIYRIAEKSIALDLLAGARYATVSTDLVVEPGKYPKILEGRSVSESINWWDGFVGMRGLIPLSKRWSLLGYAELGAGGSNFTFQGIAGVNLQVAKHFILRGGYRYLMIDVQDNLFVYDVQIGGPYLGLGIVF